MTASRVLLPGLLQKYLGGFPNSDFSRNSSSGFSRNSFRNYSSDCSGDSFTSESLWIISLMMLCRDSSRSFFQWDILQSSRKSLGNSSMGCLEVISPEIPAVVAPGTPSGILPVVAPGTLLLGLLQNVLGYGFT